MRIKHLSQEGNRRAKLISKIQDNFEDFFATILFIGNLLNITVATIGTSLAISIIGENSATAILIATVVTTVVKSCEQVVKQFKNSCKTIFFS